MSHEVASETVFFASESKLKLPRVRFFLKGRGGKNKVGHFFLGFSILFRKSTVPQALLGFFFAISVLIRQVSLQ